MVSVWMIERRYVTDHGAPFASGANDWHPVNWSQYEGSAIELADSLRRLSRGFPKEEFRIIKFTPADSFPDSEHIGLEQPSNCKINHGVRILSDGRFLELLVDDDGLSVYNAEGYIYVFTRDQLRWLVAVSDDT